MLIGIPSSPDVPVLSKLACRRARRLCPDRFMLLLPWPALARRALGRRRWTLRSISNMLICDCKAPGREGAVCASSGADEDMPFSAESCRPSSAVEGGILGPIFSWDKDLHFLGKMDCRGKTTLKEEQKHAGNNYLWQRSAAP